MAATGAVPVLVSISGMNVSGDSRRANRGLVVRESVRAGCVQVAKDTQSRAPVGQGCTLGEGTGAAYSNLNIRSSNGRPQEGADQGQVGVRGRI